MAPDAARRDQDLGLLPWSGHLLEMLIDASCLSVDMEAAFLMQENYCRVSPDMRGRRRRARQAPTRVEGRDHAQAKRCPWTTPRCCR